jgi:lipopolysaccharide transport system permease protein
MQETAVTTTTAAQADRPEYALDPEPPVRIIRPVKRRVGVSELWRSRGVTREIATRDFKSKYKQSVLGPLWLIIQPVVLLIAFTVVFGGVTDAKTFGVPYPVFALAGLTIWLFFQSSFTAGSNSMVINITLVRRTSAPRISFPTAALITSLPILALTVVLTLIVAIASGNMPDRQFLLAPLGLAWLMVLTWAVSTLLATITARFRDIMYLLPLVLQSGMFVSPIGYSAQEADGWARVVLALNPLSGLVEAWRWIALPDMPIDMFFVYASLGWTVVLTVGAWWLFAREEPTMADYV